MEQDRIIKVDGPGNKPELAKLLEGARVDQWNRVMCSSKRSNGEPCRAPAISGGSVCRVHGGARASVRRKAKMRLAELVMPAVATLGREMVSADKSADRQRAANSILDRAGVVRGPAGTSPEEQEAMREVLKERLRAMATEGLDVTPPWERATVEGEMVDGLAPRDAQVDVSDPDYIPTLDDLEEEVEVLPPSSETTHAMVPRPRFIR